MSSFWYVHAPMNASKSAQLLMVAHNYEERNLSVLTIKPVADTRDGAYIKSRALGIERKVDMVVDKEGSILGDYIRMKFGSVVSHPSVILVDEAQFLTKQQVDDLREIVNYFDVPVMAYGLRTDAFTNLFEGSKRLFEVADKFQEFKTICPCCGGKAVFNMRLSDNGKPLFEGDQEQPGNNYLPVCTKYYYELKDQYN
jgi:thymidine kinase